MPITPEQAEQIKEQLLQQLENFPEDKREQIKEQVMQMSPEQLEEFLKQNQLAQQKQGQQQCIFCSIAQGKTPAYKIGENQNNIAILEINPLSKGHTLIVPKEHLSQTSETAQELAKQVSEKIQTTLKPKEVKTNPTSIMDHSLLEVVPVYENEKLDKRKKATEAELKKLQETLMQTPPQKQPVKIKKQKPEPIPKLKPRIP